MIHKYDLTDNFKTFLESALNANSIRFDNETGYICGIYNNPSDPENAGEHVNLIEIYDPEFEELEQEFDSDNFNDPYVYYGVSPR